MEPEEGKQSSSDSDDEAPVNIVGNIPLEWYDEFDHIGWTATGEKVIPKERPNAVDEIIRRSTDPDWWRRIYDQYAGEYRTLTPEDLDLIERIRTGRVALRDFQLYQPFHERDDPIHKIHPVTNFIRPRTAFIPSKATLYRVQKFISQIRQGEKPKVTPEGEEEHIDIWSSSFDISPQSRRGRPAPKLKPPTTDDSYHPVSGPGRLFDVPGYQQAVRERFERCKDLYLCPRELQTRIPDSSSELLPELPDLEELRPYPTVECIRYVGHVARVRCVDVSPNGAFFVSGSSDGELRIWELQTGWCMSTIKLSEYCEENVVTSVSFFPSPGKPIIAACCGKFAFLIRLHEDDFDFPPLNDNFKQVAPNILSISQPRVLEMRQCVFNRSGTFLALLGQSRMVFIYNTNTWDFRTPITSARSYIQCVQFHPIKPQFFVATQHHILIFDLVERVKLLQLRPQVQWISSIDVHPRGDHVIAASYDGRAFWFDTELQVEPFKVLRTHTAAVRDAKFHRRFPLFATASDDTKVYVFHGAVFDDLITNPRIVPVKELNGHTQNNILGVLALVWHPTQPWLISAGADHSIRLWC